MNTGVAPAAANESRMEVKEVCASYVVEAGMRVAKGYKQTEVGVIPEDWDVVPLATLTSEIGDGIHATPIYSAAGGYFFINGNNLRDGKIFVPEETKTVDHSEFKKHRKYLGDGSILMSINGTIGNLGLFAGEAVVLGKSAAYINVKASVSKLFVYQCLQTELVKRQFIDGLTGTTIKNLGLATVRNTEIAFPPTKAEQEAIAEALSDADALIESLEQLLAKKRQIRQGAMQELLTSKKRLPGFSGEWEVRRLGDVIEKFVGGGTPSRSIPHFWGDEIPWVTVKDFATFNPHHSQEAITRVGLHNSASHLIPKGTLITSTRMALGKAVIYKADVAINQDLKALFPTPVLATQYLYFWFQYHCQSIDELGSGSTVKGISLPDLKKIEFQLPPLPEQTAIATVLTEMDAELAALEAKLAKARQIKQGMMQELLTGRIRLV